MWKISFIIVNLNVIHTSKENWKFIPNPFAKGNNIWSINSNILWNNEQNSIKIELFSWRNANVENINMFFVIFDLVGMQ